MHPRHLSRMHPFEPARSPFPTGIVECLEPRIAPAVLIKVGAPTDTDPANTTYLEGDFFNAADANPYGTQSLFAGSTNHYALPLSAGDKVFMWPEWNEKAKPDKSYLSVEKGSLLAFFQDRNRDGRVEAEELTGLSLSSGAAVKVAGSIDGDVVVNFDFKSRLLTPGSLIPDGTIVSLNVQGDILGRVVSGGSMAKISISGTAEQLTTSSDGTYTYSWGGTGSAFGSSLLAAYTPAAGKAGGSLQSIQLGAVDEVVAGVGGSQGKGGSILGLSVLADSNGFLVAAGRGGDGAKAGPGGSVSGIIVSGTGDADPTVPVYGDIRIVAGAGGASLTGSGGAGGGLSRIDIGFQLEGKKIIKSPEALNDYVSLAAGAGGQGAAAGGAGGTVSGIQVFSAAPQSALIDEIEILGGAGGNASLPTGKAGAGGGVSSLMVQNLNASDALDPSLRDTVAVRGGSAGLSTGPGAPGGSLTGLSILGDQVVLQAGSGSSGSSGGAGGSVAKVQLSYQPGDRVDLLSIRAGQGGTATTGAGGTGGQVTGVEALYLDFDTPGNEVVGGQGGTSLSGAGGKGGSLDRVSIFEPAAGAGNGLLSFTAGAGGSGGKSGGAGGDLNAITYLGFATLPSLAAGAGGDGPVAGAGGRLQNSSVKIFDVSNLTGSGILQAASGAGGAGTGPQGKGGAGGLVSSVTLIAATTPALTNPGLSVLLTAGDGGPGASVGNGGAVDRATVSASTGSASLVAGQASPSPGASKPGQGGFLKTVSVSAFLDISLQAGDGHAGGHGGSISNAAWYGMNADFQPDPATAPAGTVTVAGGQGSVGPAGAGAGGSLLNLAGQAGDGLFTRLSAGDGNGGVAGSKAAPGGAVSGLSIYGGDGRVEVTAGHGGSLLPGSKGTAGDGGSISKVATAPGVVLQFLAAGNGGDSPAKAGRGGSLTEINTFGDIGTRSGAAFGSDGMGGLFAGLGGTGGDAKLNGQAGSVTQITAAAISAIVAGRPTTASPADFGLAHLVDRVFLRGLTPAMADIDPLSPDFGAFLNFSSANLVGGVAGNPAAPGANVFQINVAGVSTPIASNPFPWTLGTTRPLDGFVAALTLGANKNFRPEAFLTAVPGSVSGTGYALIDERNTFDS